jgi:hypothetical protein
MKQNNQGDRNFDSQSHNIAKDYTHAHGWHLFQIAKEYGKEKQEERGRN